MSLVLVRISLHLAEHARCLFVMWNRFISTIAFFHSAGVYGKTGNEAGTCCDCRFVTLMGGLDLIMGVISLALRLCAGVVGNGTGSLA